MTALCCIGFSQSIVDSTFNNFLNENYSISNLQRSILEVPREVPGLIVVFVTAVLFFISDIRFAMLSNLLAGIGILLTGIIPGSFNILLTWIFIFSLGQHIFLPLYSSIGMELAKEGQAGKRLGQLGSANAFAFVTGSFIISILFSVFNFTYKYSYIIAAAGYFIAAYLIHKMKTEHKRDTLKNRLKLRKEYGMYYWLTILFGTRKQIFLTFAPWVLVTVFHQKTELIAFLLTIGGILGIFLRPFLGKMIDKKGERFILGFEAATLVIICFFYGFAKFMFAERTAFLIVCICYVLDQLLMAFGMARATYLKKIALSPSHVSNTLVMGTTIDHVFSISIAVLGGIIWTKAGFQYVFFLGVIIALINYFSVLRMKTTKIEA